jgi:hypothetical protein
VLVWEKNPADTPDVPPAQNSDGTLVIRLAGISALLEANTESNFLVEVSQSGHGPIPTEVGAAIKDRRIMAVKLQALAELKREPHGIPVLAALNVLAPLQQVAEVLLDMAGIGIGGNPEDNRRPLTLERNQNKHSNLEAAVD